MPRHTAQACSQDTVDELRDQVRLLRQVVRQLALQQGVYQSDDAEARKIVRLLTRLEMAHPLDPVPPNPVTTITYDEKLPNGLGYQPRGSWPYEP